MDVPADPTPDHTGDSDHESGRPKPPAGMSIEEILSSTSDEDLMAGITGALNDIVSPSQNQRRFRISLINVGVGVKAAERAFETTLTPNDMRNILRDVQLDARARGLGLDPKKSSIRSMSAVLRSFDPFESSNNEAGYSLLSYANPHDVREAYGDLLDNLKTHGVNVDFDVAKATDIDVLCQFRLVRELLKMEHFLSSPIRNSTRARQQR